MKNSISVGLIVLLSIGVLTGKQNLRNHSEKLQFNKFWESDEIMSDYKKRADEAYQNYINTAFDEVFEVNIIYESPNYGKSSADNYLLVVNHELYNSESGPYFNTYISDLESEGWLVRLVTSTNTGDQELLRNYLIQEWNDNYIRGSFLIGGLPIAFYEMPIISNYTDTVGWNYFPCDLFFMDMDGEWIDDSGNSGFYNDHTGAVAPDMWVGRLYTPTMTYHGVDENSLVIRYLEKNHNYREGKLRLKDQALCYVEPDWAGPPDESEVFIVYDEVGFYNHGILGVITSADDYRYRVRASTNNKYEWLYLAAHSSAKNHSIGGKGFSSIEIDAIDVQVLFFLNFNCSSALITANDCLCSWYVMQEPYGLISIGSSKPGSMVCQAEYYNGVASGNTLGDAYFFWGLDYFEMRDWHYGLIFIGDPTLKISRFMDKPGPNFCYALSPGRNDTVATATPVFQWTVTDSADHYKLVIEGPSIVWTSEELQETSYQLPGGVLESNTTYSWSIKAYNNLDCIDFSQPRSITYLNPASSTTVTDRKNIPLELTILGNYPNPFNPQTTIRYQLPVDGHVKLHIFDLSGRLVETLVNENQPSGEYSKIWNAESVSSGIYLYRLETKDFSSVKKCVKLK